MPRPLAVITGSSSGIGEAITRALLQNGWRVIGISRRTPKHTEPEYYHITLDLTDTNRLTDTIPTIIREHGPLTLLVNNAGVGHFAPHEELSVRQIEELVQLNLLAPLILTRGFLRSLKETRGTIVSIGSFSAHEASSFGAAYAATKAGLEHFQRSLFDEVRKSGVKVTTITPDITRTPFYDNLSFYPEENATVAVTPECVAHAVMQLLSQREGTVTTQITLRPERLQLGKRRRGSQNA
jgi:short-subunit dehydrogenase